MTPRLGGASGKTLPVPMRRGPKASYDDLVALLIRILKGGPYGDSSTGCACAAVDFNRFFEVAYYSLGVQGYCGLGVEGLNSERPCSSVAPDTDELNKVPGTPKTNSQSV